MNNEWDEYAAGWDVDPTVEEYALRAFSELTNIINIEGLNILDFGCGTGALAQLMSPKANSIVAIDPASKMIHYLDNKALNNVSTISDYLSNKLIKDNPLLTQKFDLIVASSVCAFLPDYEATFALLTSLLKSEGVLVQWDWLAESDESPMGLAEYRVKNTFELNHFKNISITSPFEIESKKGTMAVLMASGKSVY